jgi:hypothetical protein
MKNKNLSGKDFCSNTAMRGAEFKKILKGFQNV